jgi:hypothetical protein
MLPASPLHPLSAKHRALLCLVLVFSFLYNPYLTAQVSAEGINVRHPFSHRATVGSSELEKYSPVVGQDTYVALDVCLVRECVILRDSATYSFLPYRNEPVKLPAFPPGSILFRPPPAA